MASDNKSDNHEEHKHNHDDHSQGQHNGHEHGGHDHSHHSHSEHHKMMIEDFKHRFWISLIITIPVLLVSGTIQDLLGFSFETGFNQYISFIFSSAIFFYGGYPFLKGLKDEVGGKQPGMMTLIAVAISVAYLYSSAAVFLIDGKLFFWELATLIDVMLLGHWIEMRSVVAASRSMEKLVEMMPSEAHLIKDGETKDVKISELSSGDLVLIKPGEKIPADGNIAEGETRIDESMLTGEPEPVKKQKDDEVIGGSINGNSSIKVKISQVGDDAYLNKVVKMVEEAQNKKSKTQNLADKFAFYLTIVALGVGFITLAAWLLAGKEFVFALERMATVMVITCPHALGLAVPLVVARSTSISAQNGLLIRNRTAFENAGKITMIAFDKTGTLTHGKFAVSEYKSYNDDMDDDELLTLAASVEANSEHPIGSGILNKFKDIKGKELKDINNFEAVTGKGVKAKVDGKEVMISSPGNVKKQDLNIPEEPDANERQTLVYVIIDNKVSGYIKLEDSIREDSYEAVKTLKERNIKVYMLTGDNEKTAKNVAEELGLDGYEAQILPDEKQKLIKKYHEQGEYIAMTGDGVNDAPALAEADIGIAVGSGTDIAAETADIILVDSNPKDIVSLLTLGKNTYKKIIQNFVWATGYNVFAIPLAAGVLYSVGILISPAAGAVLMSMSTVIVAINAQLLKK